MPFSLIGSQLLVAGTGLVMTRFLTPSGKGTFTAAYVVASIAYLCGGLSLPHAVLLRTVSDQRLHIDAGVVRRVGAVVMIMAVVATSALALTGTVTSPGALVLLLLLPPWMLAFDLASFRALAGARGYSRLRIGQAALFGVFTAVALVITTGSVVALLGSLLVSYVISVVGLAPRPGMVDPMLDRVASEGAVLGGGEFFAWVRVAHPGIVLGALASRADLLIVTLTFPPRQIGYYAAASAVPGLLAFMGQGLGTIFIRRVKVSGDVGRELRVGCWILVSVTAPVAVVLALAARPVTRLLFGSAYLPAAGILAVLGLAAVAWNLSSFASQLLLAIDRPDTQTKAQALAVGILVVFSLVGAATGHLVVPAAGNVIAYTVAATIQLRVLVQARSGHSVRARSGHSVRARSRP